MSYQDNPKPKVERGYFAICENNVFVMMAVFSFSCRGRISFSGTKIIILFGLSAISQFPAPDQSSFSLFWVGNSADGNKAFFHVVTADADAIRDIFNKKLPDASRERGWREFK
jgi:hypothetical protein